MTTASPGNHIWIIGPGRMGMALGSLLLRTGLADSLIVSGRSPAAPEHALFRGPGAAARYQSGLRLPSPPPAGILLAVPDGVIAEVARRLAEGGVAPGTPTLHLSGSLGLDALDPLAAVGCSVGSLHPLAAVPELDGRRERLHGVWFGVEGEGPAREFAERIVSAADGRLLAVVPGGKPLYHAAAVFASNYLVVLLEVAERLMAEAGLPPAAAREALTELAGGALANVREAGPALALTGPVSRGDADIVSRHLARLSGEERALYSLLARRALALAREKGIDPELAERVEHVLRGSE